MASVSVRHLTEDYMNSFLLCRRDSKIITYNFKKSVNWLIILNKSILSNSVSTSISNFVLFMY